MSVACALAAALCAGLLWPSGPDPIRRLLALALALVASVAAGPLAIWGIASVALVAAAIGRALILGHRASLRRTSGGTPRV